MGEAVSRPAEALIGVSASGASGAPACRLSNTHTPAPASETWCGVKTWCECEDRTGNGVKAWCVNVKTGRSLWREKTWRAA